MVIDNPSEDPKWDNDGMDFMSYGPRSDPHVQWGGGEAIQLFFSFYLICMAEYK